MTQRTPSTYSGRGTNIQVTRQGIKRKEQLWVLFRVQNNSSVVLPEVETALTLRCLTYFKIGEGTLVNPAKSTELFSPDLTEEKFSHGFR